MNKLLIILALMSSSVSAQEIFATAANEGGGKIVLLTDRDKCQKGQLSMFAATLTGYSITGCWKMIGSYVSARFNDGSTRMYDGDIFTLSDYYNKKLEPITYH